MSKALTSIGKLFTLLTFLTFSIATTAQKPIDNNSREILPLEEESRRIVDNMSVSEVTGMPINIRGISYKVDAQDTESAAREYLVGNKELLGLTDENINEDLSLIAIREGLSGKVVRLQQNYRGIPVLNSQITIHINKSNRVTYVANSFKYGIANIDIEPTISMSSAFDGAVLQSRITLPTTYLKEELIIFKSLESQNLAYRHVLTGQEYDGEWEIITDAKDGRILKSHNISFNCKQHDHQSKTKKEVGDPPTKDKEASSEEMVVMVSGTGNVFNPDPLTTARATYGDPGFTDANDNNTPQMSATRENVQLLDITQDGANFELKGPWAEVVDHEAPFKGLFTQTSSEFNYDRFDDNFEAVNVYYHIDASMRHLNITLGLNIKPYQYATGVRVDPSGLNGSDNSHYSGGSGNLAFGEGGVDDAEDSDVIHHELGHGLHDWVTSGGLSQVNGLSEGSGDYWAASYNRSIDQWTPSDPAYYHTFRWDGHNQFWGGRSVNYRPNAPDPPYPGGLVGSIHTDGQIWATCMMDVYDNLGKNKTDAIFWEGLGMTNGSTNQDGAANAVFQAAIDMGFRTYELRIIEGQLEACGYNLPEVPLANCDDTGDVSPTGSVTMDLDVITDGAIISDQVISGGADVFYQAATRVDMNIPLEVAVMSQLTVAIDDCIVVPGKK